MQKGQRYGRLVAAQPEGRKWRFMCDCGNERLIEPRSVRIGATRSCGCLRREVSKARKAQMRAGKWDRYIDRSAGPDACWPWTAGTYAGGYGMTRCEQDGFKMRHAHRAYYMHLNGPLPQGVHVLHTCDNRMCCNPAHLFLGSNKDNVDDKMRKGRHVALAGSEHPLASFTDEQARGIRELLRKFKLTHRAVADSLGVSRTAITSIVRNKTYRTGASA